LEAIEKCPCALAGGKRAHGHAFGNNTDQERASNGRVFEIRAYLAVPA
jgi:hypothetical protein